MRSDLFASGNLEVQTGDRSAFHSQLLRVTLDGDLVARQGSLVAYQGVVEFAYQGLGV